jgi:hypothetical protein
MMPHELSQIAAIAQTAGPPPAWGEMVTTQADFYLVCHSAVPALIAECRRLQGLLATREGVLRAAHGVINHWNEFGAEYDLAEWMDHLEKALNTLKE